MEKLQTQLVKALAAVAKAQEKCDGMGQLLQAQSEHIQQSLLKHPNPSTYQQGLAYLAHLQHQLVAQRKNLHELQADSARLRAENIAQQRKLDGLAEHRAQAQDTYAAEIIRREAAEADRDWIGRSYQRAEVQPEPTEVLP